MVVYTGLLPAGSWVRGSPLLGEGRGRSAPLTSDFGQLRFDQSLIRNPLPRSLLSPPVVPSVVLDSGLILQAQAQLIPRHWGVLPLVGPALSQPGRLKWRSNLWRTISAPCMH